MSNVFNDCDYEILIKTNKHNDVELFELYLNFRCTNNCMSFFTRKKRKFVFNFINIKTFFMKFFAIFDVND